MSDWRYTTIGALAEVFDGPHATPTKTKAGPWFLSISSLDRGRLRLSESAHLSEEEFDKWTRRVTPKEGDTLFSYETRLGEAALMPSGFRACLGRRMGLLRPRREVVNPRFLLYAYLGPEFQDLVRRQAIHGATVDRILLSELPGWPIRVPVARSEQDAIAEILGALDDKIASNESGIQTAHALMRLHFRRMTMAGRVTSTIGDVAEVFDGPHSTPEKTESGPWFLSISSLQGGRLVLAESAHLGEQDFARWTRRVTPKGGDVLFSYETRLGEAALMPNGVRACLGRRMALLRPRNDSIGPRTLLQAYLSESFQETVRQRAVHGATVDRIPLTELPRWPILLPKRAEKLEPLLGATDNVIAQRERENATLADLRETLLSGLMLQQIHVGDATKIAEEALQ